jgi:hypothetical protein
MELRNFSGILQFSNEIFVVSVVKCEECDFIVLRDPVGQIGMLDLTKRFNTFCAKVVQMIVLEKIIKIFKSKSYEAPI